jgi:hypothetical protein
MTTPDERTRAVLKSLEFLTALASPARTPDVPEAVRQRAETLLRYNPEVADMAIARNACPHWFGPIEYPGYLVNGKLRSNSLAQENR